MGVVVGNPHHTDCEILVPPPGTERRPSAGTVQSPNQWTAWESPVPAKVERKSNPNQ